jgi:predicted RNA-binding protein (virulence factor B family)
MLAAMPFREMLGRVVTLPILRFAGPGAFLAADPSNRGPGAPTILLPGAEVSEGAKEGDDVDVFITLDSEDRPLATVFMPKLTLGEVAFLRVTSLAPFGAFFDWGLPKELLVPHKEQTREVLVGDFHPIGLYVDDTGRLAGTMRVTEMLRDKGEFKEDEWVDGEAWRRDPDIGIFVIVEKAFVGLLPKSEPNTLGRGEAARFRVSLVLPDGRIELSLRGQAHEEIEGDSRRVLARLDSPDAPRVSDKSSPEEIRHVFGLSKKAFKRAVGRLLRERAIIIADDGTITVAK